MKQEIANAMYLEEERKREDTRHRCRDCNTYLMPVQQRLMHSE